MQKLIVVIGPTASQKTTLAHKIALAINGEIINGDVFQMYKDINVGINKPSISSLAEVNYHLVNKLDINDKYSIFDYQKDFIQAYELIASKHKPVILCGGSHLYIDAVTKGYDLSNQEIQNHYEQLASWTTEQLYEYLQQYDTISAQKTVNNPHRMKRAVAYLKAHNNRPKQQLEQENNCAKYETLFIMTTKPREQLYHDINERFDNFFCNNKWIDEVKYLVDKYGKSIINSQAFKAIGYREIYRHIVDNSFLDLDKIKARTRHLAKHQLTWCNNKFTNKIIFNCETDNFVELITKVNRFIND